MTMSKRNVPSVVVKQRAMDHLMASNQATDSRAHTPMAMPARAMAMDKLVMAQDMDMDRMVMDRDMDNRDQDMDMDNRDSMAQDMDNRDSMAQDMDNRDSMAQDMDNRDRLAQDMDMDKLAMAMEMDKEKPQLDKLDSLSHNLVPHQHPPLPLLPLLLPLLLL